MNRFKKIFILLFGVMACMQIQAQDKIVNPDISYAGTPRTLKIGGINVSGVEGYEDYVLTGISGLSVGDEITVPGDEMPISRWQRLKPYVYLAAMFAGIAYCFEGIVELHFRQRHAALQSVVADFSHIFAEHKFLNGGM